MLSRGELGDEVDTALVDADVDVDVDEDAVHRLPVKQHLVYDLGSQIACGASEEDGLAHVSSAGGGGRHVLVRVKNTLAR